jgi:hypothetical protein
LFVGESTPVSGDFFYRGNPLVTQIVMSAIEESLPGQGTIASFKANGWYLDDLSITPIDNLRGKARRDACVAARESLAERIATHKPLAIVSLMLGIREDVEAATTIARCNVRHITTPFPGMGQQRKFRDQMRPLCATLPRHGTRD